MLSRIGPTAPPRCAMTLGCDGDVEDRNALKHGAR